VLWNARRGPGFERALVSILQAIFGKVEVAAQAPDEARENTRAFAARELVDDAAEHARLLG
jgi:hypothetical protein